MNIEIWLASVWHHCIAQTDAELSHLNIYVLSFSFFGG